MGTENNDPLVTDPTLQQVGLNLKHWWAKKVVAPIDQPTIIEKVREESNFSPRYVFMISMSAGIAILGLLLSSPAVVIGAMLLSPLMGPILGAGFALAIGDAHWLKDCGRTLLIGTVIAILFCTLIVVMSPLQTVTSEIAARTRPNLFDLAVALFSALAGSYAMIKGREGTIVGVAIATALMPPLAAVGFGLATLNWTVFGGALMLFITNLMTIALSAAVMARIYGFRTSLSPRQTMVQSVIIISSFVLLAVPLGISLQQIAWEAKATATINGVIKDEFESKSRISAIDIDFGSDRIKVTASVLTPHYQAQAVNHAERSLSRMLSRPIEISINQFQVGTASGEVEAAQIAAANAKEQDAASARAISELEMRLALVAGVRPTDVLMDKDNRRAVVSALALPNGSLAAYHVLEGRVAATAPEWKIELRPPAAPLPAIEMQDAAPTPAGEKALQLAIWAANRIGTPVGLNGSDTNIEAIRQQLNASGVQTSKDSQLKPMDGKVTLGWLAPDQAVSTQAAPSD